MSLLTQLFTIFWKLALPVGVLSFLMVGWALRKGILKERSGVRALAAEIKALSKSNRKKTRKKDKTAGQESEPQVRLNAVHGKWMKFGGGFYGTVALYTYGLVEWREVQDFIASFGGFMAFIDRFSIEVLIRMLIEGLKNFVTAISWPVYWIRDFGSEKIWIWITIAYGAYWLGMKAALRHASRDP